MLKSVIFSTVKDHFCLHCLSKCATNLVFEFKQFDLAFFLDLRHVLSLLGQKVDDPKRLKQLMISADPNDKGCVLFSKSLRSIRFVH